MFSVIQNINSIMESNITILTQNLKIPSHWNTSNLVYIYQGKQKRQYYNEHARNKEQYRGKVSWRKFDSMSFIKLTQ
jgi:hypothetical protein